MDSRTKQRLTDVALRLIDQDRASVIVPAQQQAPGFWFGGGNMAQDDKGTLWLCGRFRNHGDSRTGLGAGERGLELAIFRSNDGGESFHKALHFSKDDLKVGEQSVLSIEGSALRIIDGGVELYISSEKSNIAYPEGLESYLKPGTGVWTIDRIEAGTIEQLCCEGIETVLETSDPRFVHIKDPFIGMLDGQPCLMFCSHPFCWTSSNTGYVPIENAVVASERVSYDFFPRGFAWDVAITRGTSMLRLPKIGCLSELDIDLFFYDGGECVRDLDAHKQAVKRPRGYSCEELGGVAFCENGDLNNLQRLSITAPLFVSPHGTGCSRYVDLFFDGSTYFATWQQAQADGSQPLVMNRIPKEEIEAILR